MQTMCALLNLPRSTYYTSLDKTERIIEIYNESDKRYGAASVILECGVKKS